MPTLSSNRPYLIRALHQWISDNQLTPYILVDATQQGTQVPTGFVQDGKIVLNIDYQATKNLQITNDFLIFDARFGGSPHHLIIPIHGILAIYCRENGQGMAFEMDNQPSPEEPPPSSPPKPGLKLVK